MTWLRDFLLALLASYALIGVVGFFCKAWYLIFMFGWNLL